MNLSQVQQVLNEIYDKQYDQVEDKDRLMGYETGWKTYMPIGS